MLVTQIRFFPNASIVPVLLLTFIVTEEPPSVTESPRDRETIFLISNPNETRYGPLMASKFGLAGGIPERRVRPVWDAIDSRQFKNALKLSTALLAKFPNSPYALVRSFPLRFFSFLEDIRAILKHFFSICEHFPFLHFLKDQTEPYGV